MKSRQFTESCIISEKCIYTCVYMTGFNVEFVFCKTAIVNIVICRLHMSQIYQAERLLEQRKIIQDCYNKERFIVDPEQIKIGKVQNVL